MPAHHAHAALRGLSTLALAGALIGVPACVEAPSPDDSVPLVDPVPLDDNEVPPGEFEDAQPFPELDERGPDLSDADVTCQIDADGNTDCGEQVEILERATQRAALPQLTAAIDMGRCPVKHKQLDVWAYMCDPKGWVLHLADSPTANGYGGDAGSTDHDAEGYLYGPIGAWSRHLSFFGTYDMTRGPIPGARLAEYDATRPVSAAQCQWVRMSFFHDGVSPSSCFDYQSQTTRNYLRTLHGPKLCYSAASSPTSPQRSIERDWEDAAGTDRSRWYLGINRTVGSAARNGSGVQMVKLAWYTAPHNLPSHCALP